MRAATNFLDRVNRSINRTGKNAGSIEVLNDLIKKMESLTLHDQSSNASQDSLLNPHRLDLEPHLQESYEQDDQITEELTRKFEEMSLQEDNHQVNLRLFVRVAQVFNKFKELTQSIKDFPVQDLKTTLNNIENNRKTAKQLINTLNNYTGMLAHSFMHFKKQYQKLNTNRDKLSELYNVSLDYQAALDRHNEHEKTFIFDDFGKIIPLELGNQIDSYRENWLESNETYQSMLKDWEKSGKDDDYIQQMTQEYIEEDNNYDREYKEIIKCNPGPYEYELNSNLKKDIETYNKIINELEEKITDLDITYSKVEIHDTEQQHALDMLYKHSTICYDYLNKIEKNINQGYNILNPYMNLKITQNYHDQLKKHNDYNNYLIDSYNSIITKAQFYDKIFEEWMKTNSKEDNDKQKDNQGNILKQQYRLVSKIGEGGFGTVYKAQDHSHKNAWRAVKEIRTRSSGSQEAQQAVKAFQQERDLLETLNHPQIPRLYDYIEQENCSYLVMDFIEGQTLDDYLVQAPRGKLSLYEVVKIGLQLCKVLEYLHTYQPPIIFHDLKPANVIRNPNGHLYLIDFGIARHFNPGQQEDTIALGSPGDAAPEQCEGKQTTQCSDIYSLGATLHYLLSGQDPSKEPFQFSSLDLGQYGSPGSETTTLIEQMVKIDRKDRPQTIQHIKKKLRNLKDRISRPQEEIQVVTEVIEESNYSQQQSNIPVDYDEFVLPEDQD